MPVVVLSGAGMIVSGGANVDNELSGKKLLINTYGQSIPISGGVWSGKDPKL